ncbi:MAG TPA: hypothetical protein VJA40_02755 [archaeon]|nr:hypothetical protein [archaeon]
MPKWKCAACSAVVEGAEKPAVCGCGASSSFSEVVEQAQPAQQAPGSEPQQQ